jgi:hypothetical protein
MARVVEVRDLGGIEPAAQQPDWRRSAELVFRWRMLARAAAATAGGNAVVKMKPEAKLRTKSQSAVEAAIYPPITPKAFARVPSMTVNR